tara:strand:- start:1347 stop:1688 length:342 start_codon:yes stop_codon:yes gene_type:complete
MKLLKNLFKKSNPKPKERILYAITKGTHLGSCILFIKPKDFPQDGYFAAIAIGGKDMDGGMETMNIPEKDVTDGLANGILDKIRVVPTELYQLCCNEHAERLKRKEELNESTN